MNHIYLIYGATFFGMGLVLAFQARLPATILPQVALWFLAGFGVIHAFSEWAQMEAVTQGEDRDVQRLAAMIIGAVSYASLSQFALLVLVAARRWPRWLLSVPLMVSIAWIVAAVVMVIRNGDAALLRTLEAGTRYLFSLPAALLAAWALWALRRGHSDSIGRSLAVGSFVFVVYALFSGVIVPAAPWFPASYVNSDAFGAVSHVPVEVFRMACAVGMGVSLSTAFVIQASRERQELARRREEFISIVAHDLRNPISAISLGADLLEQQLESPAWSALDQRSAQKFVATIKRSAHGLERMVEDLLDASRIETRMLALERSAVDLRPLVGDIVDRVRDQMRGHTVRVLLPEKLPQVHADPMRVEQIVINLLTNAAKYSTAGTAITLEAKVLSSEVELAVTNEGSGLTEDETGQVFTRFYRSKAQVGKVEGLGIGLYIAKGLVEAQGGHIWVDSEPGRFTTFHFTLVRTDASPEIVNAGASPGSPRLANLATDGAR